jgi:NSS family neurotransmitter:Na+ symporter
MVGVAVGLGNVWRFPYMVGKFGGAAFVLLYLVFALGIGLPALMAEWSLGRHTRRGTVGAFERAGLPGGWALGWLFFGTVTAATAYYTNAIGWVVYHGLSGAVGIVGLSLQGGDILPPPSGFQIRPFILQLLFTSTVLIAAVVVLLRGLRSGIEKASAILTPLLFLGLLLIIARSVTLPGAGEGLHWFILKFEISDITPGVALAALGQVIFSLALGGTFMVVYGSYLNPDDDLGRTAVWTVAGDTAAGLLAGLAIFPAVMALGMEPGRGPALIFETLPRVFAQIPGGSFFGTVFFLALAGAAFLSGVAALEVLIAGLTDNTGMSRRKTTFAVGGLVFLLALPPMINMEVFVPWDLTFGSGAQTAGVLVAVLAVGWGMGRERFLKELGQAAIGSPRRRWAHFLFLWVRWVIPVAILAVGAWWALTEVLGILPTA